MLLLSAAPTLKQLPGWREAKSGSEGAANNPGGRLLSTPLRGVVPIAPTPFTDSGDLDLTAQRRVLDCMIDQGVDGICILANYSEQFAVTDDERDQLIDLCIAHVAGRVPVIATCSHFSTRIAADRGRMAARAGA